MKSLKLDPLTNVTFARFNAPAPARDEGSFTGESAYEKDFVGWIEGQARLLRSGNLALLDVRNLTDELEAMARSEKRELGTRLRAVLLHLLKCRYQPEQRSSGWLGTLEEQRDRLDDLLVDSPSLERLIDECLVRVYPSAVRKAARETGLAADIFPAANPFSKVEVLDLDYVPGA